MDLNVVNPKYDVDRWNETRWNGCWNPEQGVGVYLHMGRYRHDLDLWWAQVIAYLPDCELYVERFFGRNTSDAGAALGGLEVRITPDGWTAVYDGAGQISTIDAMAQAPQGSSGPIRRATFEIAATAVQPEWDIYAGVAERMDFAGDTHVQGSYRTTGSLTVGSEQYSLDGIGFKDHSSGVRDFRYWYGHRFFVIVAPDYSCHAVVMYSPQGEPLPAVGAFFSGGRQARVTRFELPELEDSAGGPVHGEVVIETDSGEHLQFAAELVHAAPMLMMRDNYYVNGIDWELDDDEIVLIEGKGLLTAPDGSVVHCFHERSALRSNITRPSRS